MQPLSRVHVLGVLVASLSLIQSTKADAKPDTRSANANPDRPRTVRKRASSTRLVRRGPRNRRRREVGGRQPLCVPNAAGQGRFVYQPNSKVGAFMRQNPQAFFPMLQEVCGDAIDNDCDGVINNGCPAAQPASSSCGNGVIETGEECDDGGQSAACSAECTIRNVDGTPNGDVSTSESDSGPVDTGTDGSTDSSPPAEPNPTVGDHSGSDSTEGSNETDTGDTSTDSGGSRPPLVGLPKSGIDFVTPECDGCFRENCTNFYGFDLTRLPFETLEDRALMECMIESKCVTVTEGTVSCYCGDIQDPSICFDDDKTAPGQIPNGACKDLYEAALGTTLRREIIPLFTDPTVPGGKAGFAAQNCISHFCVASCGNDPILDLPPVIPPDAPVVGVPASGIDFVTEACDTCFRSECRNIVDFDLTTLPFKTLEDRELIECMIGSRCVDDVQGPNPCYCGDVEDPSICFGSKFLRPEDSPNGPCKAEYEEALGTKDRALIGSVMTDPNRPGGAAGFSALACISEMCNYDCGTRKRDNGTSTTTTTGGGSQVPTVGAPTNGIDFVTPQCDSCFRDNCTDVMGFDLTRLPFESLEDRALLECMIESKCVSPMAGPNNCYCGDVQNPTICFDENRTAPDEIPNGPCKVEYETALGTTLRSDIAPILTDPNRPGGKAGAAALGCITQFCVEPCGAEESDSTTSTTGTTTTTTGTSTTGTTTTTSEVPTVGTPANGLDFVTPECTECFYSECSDVEDFDFTRLPFETLDDRALIECIIREKCVTGPRSSLPCYCGDVEDTSICFDPQKQGQGQVPNGPCKQAYEKAMGTTDRGLIQTRLWDASIPGGKASLTAGFCIGEICLSECGTPEAVSQTGG